MSELRQRMIECLQLRGLSARTQESYIRAVRQLAEHYHKSPELITEEELRQYFLSILRTSNITPAALPPSPSAASSSSLSAPWKRLGHLQPRAVCAREETAGHPQRRGSAPDPWPRQITALQGLSQHHLLLRPATAGRR